MRLFTSRARLSGHRTKGLASDLPSAAQLLRDISRLKRAIFFAEFVLLGGLFCYEVSAQYRYIKEHERDLVGAYLERVVEKAQVLIGMAGDELGRDRGADVHDEAALERAIPLKKIVALDAYAAAAIALGATLVDQADDGTPPIADARAILSQAGNVAWWIAPDRGEEPADTLLRTKWMWFEGVPYLAIAGPIGHFAAAGEAGGPQQLSLILLLRFDAARLGRIAGAFDIDALAVVRDGGAYNNGIELTDSSGEVFGVLAWNSQLGGSLRLLELTLVVGALALLMLVVGRYLVGRMASVGEVLDRIHQANLREKSRLRGLIEASNDGLVVLDSQGIIQDCNSAVFKRSGLSRSEIIGLPVETFMSGLPLDDPEFLTGHKTVRTRVENADGETAWIDVGGSRFEDDDAEERFIIVARDVSRRVEAEEAVWHKAHFDSLTDLPNRALFTTRLNAELMHAKDEGTQCVLMFVDLDGFKSVNDTLGHDAGDALLVDVAGKFRAIVPEEVMVARLGGDEFGIVLPAGATLAEAEQLAETLGRGLSRSYGPEGKTVEVSASIGIARAPRGGRDLSGLLRAADKAMYTAKRAGRGRYAIAEEEGTGGGENFGYRAVKRYS